LFSKGSQPTTGGLFAANSQSIAFQKIPDDPAKKRARLFLNKLESDVTFKVEDQEFPSLKSILSENTGSSKTCSQVKKERFVKLTK